MSTTTVLEPGGPTPTAAPERISMFQRIADRVSYGMGTPQPDELPRHLPSRE